MKTTKNLLIALCMLLSLSAIGQEKPNILFIFTDDQTFESIGAINNTALKTPNLDRLAQNGTYFSHTFNMGSWSPAVCLASRKMLNTGMFVWEANEVLFTSDKPKPGKKMITPWSVLMKNAGYDTYFTGKWHVYTDTRKIFDHVKDVRPGMPNQTDQRYNRKFIEGESDTWSPYDTSMQGFWKGGKHWSEVVADHTVDFLENAQKQDNPFFMYVAFNAPHDPRQSPKEYVDMYPAASMELPKSFIPEYPYADAAASPPSLRDERLAPNPRTPYSIKVNRSEYYALISHMDAQIGRILDALEASGKAENTYIIFTSDHGLAVGDHGFLGKQNMYDRSVRVPFIISGKGVKKNAINPNMIYLQDAMATSLEIAGIDKPAHVKFNSVLSMAKGNRKHSAYKAIYGSYLENQRMVRTKDYKLIIYPTIKKIRLYHIEKDPDELVDIADNSKNKPIILKLLKNFKKLQKETGDTLDISEIWEDIKNRK